MTATGTPAPTTPKFRKPPVVELALGVQFKPLASFNTLQAMSWRESIKGQFSKVQEQPELPDLVEVPDLGEIKMQMKMVQGPQPLRYWYLNESETELVQVQRNRFVYNWRKKSDADQYPSYDEMKARVEERLKAFMAFIVAEKLGEFVPDICEVTYISHILTGGVWKSHSEGAKVFTTLSASQTGTFLPAN